MSSKRVSRSRTSPRSTRPARALRRLYGLQADPGGYPDWVTLTRAYYDASYVFVTADPACSRLPTCRPAADRRRRSGRRRDFAAGQYLPDGAAGRRSAGPLSRWAPNETALDALLETAPSMCARLGAGLWAHAAGRSGLCRLPRHRRRSRCRHRRSASAPVLEAELPAHRIDQAIARLTADGTIGQHPRRATIFRPRPAHDDRRSAPCPSARAIRVEPSPSAMGAPWRSTRSASMCATRSSSRCSAPTAPARRR